MRSSMEMSKHPSAQICCWASQSNTWDQRNTTTCVFTNSIGGGESLGLSDIVMTDDDDDDEDDRFLCIYYIMVQAPGSSILFTTWYFFGCPWNVPYGGAFLRSISSAVTAEHHTFQEGHITDQSFWLTHQAYSEESDEPRGKGSFPAMITPAYRNAKKANELASDVSTGRVTEVEIRECWGLCLPKVMCRHLSGPSESRMLACPRSKLMASSWSAHRL